MALTKVTGQVVNTSTDLTVGVLTATTASFTGNVSVGGTLTYEDVTNVDSVGLITARNGVNISGGNLQVGGTNVINSGRALINLEEIKLADAKELVLGSGNDLKIQHSGSHSFISQEGVGALKIKGDDIRFEDAGGTEALRVDSSQRLLVNTDSAMETFGSAALQVATTAGGTLVLGRNDTSVSVDNGLGAIYFDTKAGGSYAESAVIAAEADAAQGSGDYPSRLVFKTTADGAGSVTERLRIGNAGHVGIKNTVAATIDAVNSAGTLVVGDGSSAEGITIYTSDSTSGELAFADGTSGSATQRGRIIYAHGDNSMRISTNGGEALRIDTNGTILHGTTSAANLNNAGGGSARQAKSYIFNNPGTTTERYSFALIGGGNFTSGPSLFLNKTRSTSVAHTVVQDGDELGQIRFQGSDGTYYVQGARIEAEVDGTPGSQDMPGRLVFSTTADGGSSPTERMRIDSSGNVAIGPNTQGHGLLTISKSASSAFNALVIQQGNTGSTATDGLHIGIDSAVDAYITHKENRALAFGTANTERMRIDSSGNIGIGTASPSSVLHVNANATHFRMTRGASIGFLYQASTSQAGATRLQAEYGPLELRTNSNQPILLMEGGSESARIDTSGRLLIGTTGAVNTDSGNILQVVHTSGGYISFARNDTTVSNNDSLGGLRWYGNDSNGTYQPCAYIFAHADGTHQTDDKATRLVFSTTTGGDASPTERMRIDDQGIMYSVSENHGHGAYVTQSAGTVKFIFRGHHSASAGSYSSGTIAFTVWSNGNVQNINNSYGAISDVKLKENIVDASSQWNDIKAVQVRKYNFKESTGQPTHTQLGVVAQEVETVSPGLVYETTDTDDQGNDLGTVTKSVNYSVLYMKAIKALQEAQTRIESLEARLDAGGL